MKRTILFTLVFIQAFLTQALTVQSHQILPSGVQFQMSEGVLKIEVCKEDLFHVVYFPTNKITDTKNEMVIKYDWAKVNWKYSEDSSNAYITTPTNKIQIDRQTGAISYFDASGHLLLAEAADGGIQVTKAVVDNENTYNVQQSFVSPKDEAIFGLGEHTEGLMNVKDCFLRLKQFNTVIAVPFYISNKGYGLYWNNASLTEFNPEKEPVFIQHKASFEKNWANFKAEESGDYVFVVDGIEHSGEVYMTINDKEVINFDNDVIPNNLVGKVHLDAGQTYEINIRGNIKNLYVKTPKMQGKSVFWSQVADRIDYYFFAGKKPDHVIANLRELTGAAPMFPKWNYGFNQSRYAYDSQDKMLGVAKGYRDRQIPLDVVIQDAPYWTISPESKRGEHYFDKTRYSDPDQMLKDLHTKYNTHVIISVWPAIDKAADTYDYFLQNGYVVSHVTPNGTKAESDEWLKKQTSLTVDVYNPDARKAYWKYMKERLFDKGIDGWWLDASEPEWVDDFGKAETYAGSGAKNLNTYSLYQTKAIYEGQRATTSDKRVVILTRSGFTGQQRYATECWSGDIGLTWNVLHQQISTGLSYSMSGLPYWTCDIGGFLPFMNMTSPSYRELVTRWYQFGAFIPIYRVHGCRNTELWQYGKNAEDIQVSYDKFRYRMMPYIYSLAHQITADGYTIFRGLVMDFPQDSKVMNIKDQFMFGPAFLVNPVTEFKARSRQVYLPEETAGWYNFWTGDKQAGGQKITVDAPEAQIPLFVPAGTILPLGSDLQYATEKPADVIELRVYTGKDGSFTIYEDENDNYDYEKGVFATIPIRWDEAKQTLTIDSQKGKFPNMLKKRIFNIVFVGQNKGVGLDLATSYDKTVTYTGKKMEIKR